MSKKIFPVIDLIKEKDSLSCYEVDRSTGVTDMLNNFVHIFRFYTNGEVNKCNCCTWGSVTPEILRRVLAEMSYVNVEI
jgi:hypothetical protein